MTALASHRDAPIRRRDRAPWSPRAWRQALYLTGAIPALAAVPLLLVVGLANRPRWFFLFLFLVVVLLAAPLLTRIHCHRLRATAGVVMSPQPIMPNGLSVAAVQQAIRSPVTWRQLGYHFLAAPAGRQWSWKQRYATEPELPIQQGSGSKVVLTAPPIRGFGLLCAAPGGAILAARAGLAGGS